MYKAWLTGESRKEYNGLPQPKGEPGAGKSVLMKEAYRRALQDRHTSGNLVGGFFSMERERAWSVPTRAPFALYSTNLSPRTDLTYLILSNAPMIITGDSGLAGIRSRCSASETRFQPLPLKLPFEGK